MRWWIGLATCLAFACGDDGPDTCEIGSTEGCDDGLVCEPVQGGDPVCAAPVRLAGRVFDALDDSGIANATIVALDANGAARSTVARSAADGTYELDVSVARTSDGAIVSEDVTLRVDAGGYQTFPTPPRTSLPIEVSDAQAMDVDGVLVVMNAATDVALLPEAGAGNGVIEGVVEGAGLDVGGVLIVAEQGGTAVSTAISDRDGEFVLFNVPDGSTEVTGYRANLRVEPATVDVAGTVSVTLSAFEDGLATVDGMVNIVNPGDGSDTSVIFVVASTFDPDAVRGEAPAGLRAAPVSGGWQIQGVPPGRYAVLAAFENDFLVRDPDESIAGTAIVFVDVAGADVTLGESFKVTGSLDVVQPGSIEVESVATVPTLEWADDSSEDGYEVRVFDAFGTMVHEDTEVPRVTGSSTVTYEWSADLQAGMIYQFRAVSWRDDRGGGGRTYISASEDLKGVFVYEP